MSLQIIENTLIGVYENFLSKGECQHLLGLVKMRSSDEIEFYNELDPKYLFWEKKNIEFSSIPDFDFDLANSVQDRVKRVFLSDYLQDASASNGFVQMNNIHRFLPGDSMMEHSDRGPKENGNNNISHGFVVYLNDEYSGGEIYYPNLGIEVKPTAGTLVIHPSDVRHTHGVRPVTLGERYTLTMFAKDPS